MATPLLSESLLVNRGLSAAAALDGITADVSDAQPTVTDVLGSFRKLITSDIFADANLVSTVGAFTSPLELATYFINAKYAELGGAAGMLGATLNAVTANGAGFSRLFHNGAIYWHPACGAHELHGPIRTRWQELGAEGSFLGFPTSDVTVGTDVHAEGSFAHFQGGSIYWAPPTLPFGVLVGAVGNLSTIAVAGVAATTPATSPTTIAIATKAAIAAKAKSKSARSAKTRSAAIADDALVGAAPALVGAAPALGGIRADVGDISIIGITPVVAESSAGAYEVHGAIREKYLAMGAEASILGYPRTDETGTPDGVGRFNHFQGGSIYWTPGTSAHEVHGLIRDRWASQGWERNPQLGYPISDELIPDPRIGHRRPETHKKPIAALPIDVIKLPAEAAAGGFPTSVVNVAPVVTQPAAPVAIAPTIRRTIAAKSASGALGKLSDKSAVALSPVSAVASPIDSVALNPALIAVVGNLFGPASTEAEQRSVNRFEDFENGVLFWFRGATTATTLSPLAATSDGTSLSFAAADIANAAITKIGRAVFETNNVQLASSTFVGTTGYSFDGVQVHNRRHKLQLTLQGIEMQQTGIIFGVPVPMPVTATVELQVEVWFDESQRRIALTPVDWALTHASSGTYGQTVTSNLRAKLDPLLWTAYELMTLPDTNADKPIAVLSVKTLPSGAVAVYVEPNRNLLSTVVGSLDSVLTPVVLASQPN